MHIHEFGRVVVNGNYSGEVECRTCGLRMHDRAEAHALAMEQVKAVDFIKLLINDKQRIAMYLWGSTIKNDRDQVVFEAKGVLPSDTKDRLDEIHRQLKAEIFCAICLTNAPVANTSACAECLLNAAASVQRWQKQLHRADESAT